MKLHGRTIAKKAGVPDYLLESACEYMNSVKKYDEETCKKFINNYTKPQPKL